MSNYSKLRSDKKINIGVTKELHRLGVENEDLEYFANDSTLRGLLTRAADTSVDLRSRGDSFSDDVLGFSLLAMAFGGKAVEAYYDVRLIGGVLREIGSGAELLTRSEKVGRGFSALSTAGVQGVFYLISRNLRYHIMI